MNAGISELLAFGLVAVVIGIFFLVNLILEVGPENRRKWFLVLGFGSGVIAFSFKMLIVMTFSSYSNEVLGMLPERKFVSKPDFLAEVRQERNKLNTSTGYRWEPLPDSAPFPENNPVTPEKIALGKKLFFDKRLSMDGSVACVSCHELSPDKAGDDGLAHSTGIHGKQGNRNAPTVINAAFQRVFFWDGRANSLEEQAKGPLINPDEMGMPSLESVERRVREIPEYQSLFARAFGSDSSITIETIVGAIATYERTLITPDTAYDRFVKGDLQALDASQLRGMALFESTGCVHCHSGPNFSGASVFGNDSGYRIFPANYDSKYIAEYRLSEDAGAAEKITNSSQGVWRIPTLRNISKTAPYFHNGSVDDLREAVKIMAQLQLNKKISNTMSDDSNILWSAAGRQLSVTSQLALSDEEIDDIVAFLKSLDGEIARQ